MFKEVGKRSIDVFSKTNGFSNQMPLHNAVFISGLMWVAVVTLFMLYTFIKLTPYLHFLMSTTASV